MASSEQDSIQVHVQ